MVIKNRIHICMNVETGKFDRSQTNSEIEPFLEEIEKLDEVDKIIKIK